MLHHVVDVVDMQADVGTRTMRMVQACTELALAPVLYSFYSASAPQIELVQTRIFVLRKLRVGTVTAEDMGHRLHMFRVDEVEKARGAAPGQATIRSNSTRQRRLPSCGARDFGCVLRIFSATCHAGRIVDLCSQDSGAQLLSRRDC